MDEVRHGLGKGALPPPRVADMVQEQRAGRRAEPQVRDEHDGTEARKLWHERNSGGGPRGLAWPAVVCGRKEEGKARCLQQPRVAPLVQWRVRPSFGASTMTARMTDADTLSVCRRKL